MFDEDVCMSTGRRVHHPAQTGSAVVARTRQTWVRPKVLLYMEQNLFLLFPVSPLTPLTIKLYVLKIIS